ncbi:MAG: hypothetical protein ACYDAC_12535 [Candidatus Dormibacteria bacterium]
MDTVTANDHQVVLASAGSGADRLALMKSDGSVAAVDGLSNASQYGQAPALNNAGNLLYTLHTGEASELHVFSMAAHSDQIVFSSSTGMAGAAWVNDATVAVEVLGADHRPASIHLVAVPEPHQVEGSLAITASVAFLINGPTDTVVLGLGDDNGASLLARNPRTDVVASGSMQTLENFQGWWPRCWSPTRHELWLSGGKHIAVWSPREAGPTIVGDVSVGELWGCAAP